MKRQKKTSVTPLPPEIKALVASIGPTADARRQLQEKAHCLEKDPQFVASLAQQDFIEQVLNILASAGVSKSALARRMGAKRQAIQGLLDPDRRSCFTLTTMAEIAIALGMELEINLAPAFHDNAWENSRYIEHEETRRRPAAVSAGSNVSISQAA